MRTHFAFALVLVTACSSHASHKAAAGGTGADDAGAGTSGAGSDGGSPGSGGGEDGSATGGVGTLGGGGSAGRASGGTAGGGGTGTGGTDAGGIGTLGSGGTAGTGTNGASGTGNGGTAGGARGGSGGTNGASGTGGSPIDCPGAKACSRSVYRIANPLPGIIRMDPYLVLSEYATGPDTALTQQTSRSDDVRTAGAETYLLFVLSCPPGRQYGITWEGYADANSTHEVLVATADGSYVQMTDWPTARVPNLPSDRDVSHTVRGLVPDSLGNIFVRVQSSGGKLYTDWFAVGSCI
jgi:hypothetical protein